MNDEFDAITEEHVERSRDMYRMVVEHDNAFLDAFDLALEYHLPESLGPVLHGPWALLETMASAADLFENPHPEAETFLPSGTALVVLGTWRAKTRLSGVSVDVPFAHVVRFRDGKIAHMRVYMDTAKMLQSIEERTG